MIKNKVDKLVLKAFLEMEVPPCLERESPELHACFGVLLPSLANRLLMGRNETIEFLKPPVVKEDKTAINALITHLPDGEEKRDLVFYYRLAVLAETLLYKYRAEV